VVDFLQLFIPRIIKWAVDDLTTFQIDSVRLLLYALYIVGIAVLIGFFRFIWRRCLIGTSRKVEEGLRNKLFAHIQTLSASYFDRVKTGDLMAHATNDIQHVRMAMGMGLVALTDAVVLGTAAMGFMAYINVRLTLFSLIPMPFIIFGARFFSRKMHRIYQEVQGAFSELTEVVRERFAGIRVIKAFNREKESATRMKVISRNYIDSNIRLVRITGSFFPMMLFLSHLSMTIVLYLGGRQTISETITPGDFVAFISYLGILTWPMMALGWVTNLIQRGKASLDRIDDILRTVPEIGNLPTATSHPHIKGRLTFENVSFSYGSDTNWALDKINIDLEPGKVLGIVGPPGSGKTTLLNLIPRLFDASKGRILIDGRDIRQILIEDLRNQIAFVPQEPFLFAGTIRENITFGQQTDKEDELIRAAKDASVYDTIQKFPGGFETIVGEKGIILSGGQKQRIALARSLLNPTPFLILDDPISQVDMETGAAIVNTIRSMAATRTVVIVSHRLSALRFSDCILVLEEGQVKETGSHAELMALGQYYAQTYCMQEIEEQRVAIGTNAKLPSDSYALK
jgi:ATP-binding cassette subfamily B protein